MGESQEVLRDVGIIIGAGILSVPVAALLRVPLMIVLVGAGLLVGPSALGLVTDDPLTGLGAQLVFTYGVALILFHGGLGIDLRIISRTAAGLAMLVLPGVFLTTAIVAAVAAPVFGVPVEVALLMGAVLAPTDPAIIIPLFERIGIRAKVAQTVIAESAFNDPVGTVLALTLATLVGTGGDVPLRESAGDFLSSLALGAGFGVVGGVVLALMLSNTRLGLWRESPAAVVLALVALEYFTADQAGGSAYLAAFVMGLIVGNMDLLRLGRSDEHERLLDVTVSQLVDLATLAVFVTLGINLPLDAISENLVGGLVVVAVLIFVARPVTVWLCLWPDRRGAWTRREKWFLSWCRYTGVVPAALGALLLADNVKGADIIVALVAIAIIATLMLQATTAGRVAGRLGLTGAGGDGGAEAPGGAAPARPALGGVADA